MSYSPLRYLGRRVSVVPGPRIGTQGHTLTSQLAAGELREDDLRAGRFLVELAYGDDAVNFFAEVIFLQVEHINSGAAGVDFAAGVVDHGDELADGRNVELLDFLFHHGGGESRHARNCAKQRGHVHSGIADGGDFQAVHALLDDGVETEESEE